MNLLASIIVVTNIGFTAAFDTVSRNPAWVAYDLEPSEVIHQKRAPHDFKPDPRVPQSDVREFYKHYGHFYDRGHLAPAADFNWNTNALAETYLFTNIAPMTRKLNRTVWLETEKEVRRLAESGTVHVVVFPTYHKLKTHIQYNTAGDDTVVPSGFAKVAYGWFGVRYWHYDNN